MHDVGCLREVPAQDDDEDEIGQRGLPEGVYQPQAGLQQDADDGKGQRQPKARLGQEQVVPVGLHGEQGERQVGDPKDHAAAPQRRRLAMQAALAHTQERQELRQQSRSTRQAGQEQGGLRCQHPCAVKIHVIIH